ncbi:hypothetical protein ACFP2T_37585 [Plantactinospora solaniradicis]|uniref:SIR2-like domain-containing protein n=1 Tax=Plantactinospora solaniradicis TaxID=1723736 RepID=A0ABW1KLN0_9ACTN
MRTVLVLGAGFSYAISPKMPLTDELGNLIRGRVAEVSTRMPRAFTGGYFEAWLSRLAEPQPDLTPAQNATNYGLFLQIAAELHRLLQERELAVLSDKPPWWLQRLVGLLHATRTTAITFNYDTLVERTAPYLMLSDWKEHGFAKPFNVVQEIPPSLHRSGWIVDRGAATFRLLKLHGSLDSYWVQNDSSGATISRRDDLGTWGTAKAVDEQQRRRQLPGREPYIVPPAAAKSAFYTNPIARELWRSAAEALQAADRIALVGYSIPPTDLVTSGMLADALAAGAKTVEVVNPYPEEIVARLVTLGQPKGQIHLVTGDEAIKRYTDQLELEQGRRLVDLLKVADRASNLLVATSPHRAARVTSVAVNRQVVELHITEIGNTSSTTAMDPNGDAPIVPVMALQAALNADRIAQVRYVSGEVATIVGVAEHRESTGLGNGHWTVLVPSAMPPQRRP